MNPYLTTTTGVRLHFLDPEWDLIHLEDIAAGLGRIPRFSGQIRSDVPTYTVAQHSIVLSHAVPPDLALQALLHDAAEAYLGGDIPSHVKPHLGNYKALEDGLMRAVALAFGLPWPLHPMVKELDRRLLINEWRALKPAHAIPANLAHLKPLEIDIGPFLNPTQAITAFCARFGELVEQRPTQKEQRPAGELAGRCYIGGMKLRRQPGE